MPPLSRDEKERLDRLAGSGRGSGGGLPLPALFSAMLNEVLDNAPVSDERMTEITSSALSFKTKQVLATWDNWEALTNDVLAQMESRELIQHKNGSWARGGKLITGELLEVIPARKGIGSKSDGVTVWDKAERAERSRTTHIEREATSLIANPRPVDRNHVQEIRDSLSTAGRLYPVLTDKHGRLLDGRHRRAADPDWPKAVALRADGMPVSTEAEALAVIRAAGLEKPLPSGTIKDIDRLLGEMAKSGRIKRDRIKAALVEDASKSNRAIAEDVGADHNTVIAVRTELQESGEIHHFSFQGLGRGQKTGKLLHGAREGCCDGLHDAVSSPTVPSVPVTEEAREEQHREFDEKVNQLREQGLTQRQIADELGATFNRVQDSWQREEGRRDERRRETAARAAQGAPPGASLPSQTQPTSTKETARKTARPKPSSLMQRIARLLSRWESENDDPSSELEELEALRREIDERIETLRR